MAVTRLRLRVGDNWYEVEVGDLSQSPLEVSVDGETFAVEVEGLPGRPSARPRRGRLQSPGVVVPPPTGRATPHSPDDDIIRSPMPGRVISIMVRPGDRVSAGQEVCVVEAMKMEQSIRATRNGVVKEVLVQPTDSVRTNDPLLSLE